MLIILILNFYYLINVCSLKKKKLFGESKLDFYLDNCFFMCYNLAHMDNKFSNQPNRNPHELLLNVIQGGGKLIVLALLLTSCGYGSVTDSLNKPKEEEPTKAEIKKLESDGLPTIINDAQISVYGLGETGTAKITATGEPFDTNTDATAASPFKGPKGHSDQARALYPLGTMLRMTNPANGKSIEVRVNDKGNFGKNGEFNRKVNFDTTRFVWGELGLNVNQGHVGGLKIEVISMPK